MLRRASRLLLLASITWPVTAHGQTESSARDGDQEIVILGNGLNLPPGTPAYGSTVIERGRLTNDASGRVEDVLRDVAGFQQYRRSDSRSADPSAQGVTLRALGGNASSRTLVLLDGVPIADPFFGFIPFNALVPGRLALVRVTPGGGAGAFGSGAVAGTIDLVSAGRRDLPLATEEASLGSRGSESISASLSPSFSGGFATVSGQFERGDGFQTTPPDQRVAASVPARYRDWSLGTRAVVPVGPNGELQVHALLFGDNRTLRFRGADSRSNGEDASVRFVSRGTWQVDALTYLQARDFANKVVSATSFKLALNERSTPSTGLGGKVEIRPPVGSEHVLRFGGDLRTADGQLFEDAYSPTGVVTARRTAGGRTTVTGLFLDEDWTIGPLVLTSGVRADRWVIANGFFRERSAAGALAADNRFAARSGTEFTGRAGALLHASSWANLRVAAYTGFRVPTLNELYRPFTVFPITTQANAALDPERLRGVEGGIDLKPLAGMEIGVTVFDNRLGDAIANVTAGPNLRRRANVGAIVAKGAEATFAWHTGAVMVSGSYAFSASDVRSAGTALNGRSPAQSPRHAGSATLAWAPAPGALASFTARYVGDQYEDDLQTNLLPRAFIVDAVAKLPIKRRLSLFARVENVLNEIVVTRNQAGSIDLGTPRTLWVGVRLGE